MVFVDVQTHQPLVVQIPESGNPDDGNGDGADGNYRSLEEDDEGEVLLHKIVHGFRWYKVRALARRRDDQVSLEICAVPGTNQNRFLPFVLLLPHG